MCPSMYCEHRNAWAPFVKEREMAARACLKNPTTAAQRAQGLAPEDPRHDAAWLLQDYLTKHFLTQKGRKSNELVGAETWKANLPLRPQAVAKAFVPPTSAVINLQVSARWYFTGRHRTRITPQWKLQSAILWHYKTAMTPSQATNDFQPTDRLVLTILTLLAWQCFAVSKAQHRSESPNRGLVRFSPKHEIRHARYPTQSRSLCPGIYRFNPVITTRHCDAKWDRSSQEDGMNLLLQPKWILKRSLLSRSVILILKGMQLLHLHTKHQNIHSSQQQTHFKASAKGMRHDTHWLMCCRNRISIKSALYWRLQRRENSFVRCLKNNVCFLIVFCLNVALQVFSFILNIPISNNAAALEFKFSFIT